MELTGIQRKLLRRLGDGRFYSGRNLADQLGVSRTTVWKHVIALGELGLKIDAVRGRGYRLERPVDLLDETVIKSHLKTHVKRRIDGFYVCDQIDSTNNFLCSKLSTAKRPGLVCLAESQTAGKGRGGRRWISPFGHNIYLSIAWRYSGGPASISGLSLAIGVAVVKVLAGLGFSGVGLKWPNDLLWRERKLGGILVEVSGDTHGPCWVVAGLGLNCSMTEQQGLGIDQQWVDLASIAPESKPDRNQLAATLINEILPTVATFDQDGLADYLDAWKHYDCLRDRQVCVHLGSRKILGKASGVSDSGMILITTQDGEQLCFASGDVSLRPGPQYSLSAKNS